MKLRLPVWLWVALIIFTDKLVKILMLTGNQTYSLNHGIAFGWGDSQLFSTFLALFMISLLTWVAVKFGRKYQTLWIILGGGLANFADRFIWGGIMDYIQIGNFPWFNFADITIFTGVVLLLWQMLQPLIWKTKRHI